MTLRSCPGREGRNTWNCIFSYKRGLFPTPFKNRLGQKVVLGVLKFTVKVLSQIGEQDMATGIFISYKVLSSIKGCVSCAYYMLRTFRCVVVDDSLSVPERRALQKR
jgi:hypothetical protein